MERRIVIIGAGLAGAATACFLARSGARYVTVFDREAVAGLHASGRNAAMIRQVVEPGPLAAMARRGRTLLDAGAQGAVEFREVGSLLLGGRARLQRLLGSSGALTSMPQGDVALLSRQEFTTIVPALHGCSAEAAITTRTDGIVDVAALLAGFVAEARDGGATFRFSNPIRRIVVEAGQVRGVESALGFAAADVVVNAAGAWCAELAREAGGIDSGMTAFRRHLLHSGRVDLMAADSPFVWDIDAELYFRPESGGVLLCACDNDPWSPGDPPINPTITSVLAAKVAAFVPRLAGLPIAKTWAGLRTFARDRSFVIGEDPHVKGLHWVGGLGGHGVTCAAAVGELAARSILSEADFVNPFSPVRFLGA